MPAVQPKPNFPRMTPKVKDAIKADPRWENLKNCIYATWQQIGSDCEACVAEVGDKPLTNAIRIETVLDANYMSTNEGESGEEAEAYVEELDKIYGYKAVARFLNNEIQL